MKRSLIVFTILITSLVQGQKGSHEVTLDIGDAMIMKTLELNYEYYVADRSSVGMSMLFNFAKDDATLRYYEENMFTPYYHYYLTENSNLNYFGEVFTAINTGVYQNKETNKNCRCTDVALGISAGAKYATDGGLIVTAIAGIGRNMFEKSKYQVVPRVGLNLGYRF